MRLLSLTQLCDVRCTSTLMPLSLQVVEAEVRKGGRVMVFCNTLDSCRATGHHLSEAGLATLSYHGVGPPPTPPLSSVSAHCWRRPKQHHSRVGRVLCIHQAIPLGPS